MIGKSVQTTPFVVAIEMGYGHLRAATPLAERLGTRLLECDHEPLADATERREWAETRRLYEGTSRLSQLPFIGAPLRRALEAVTAIPHLHPYRDLSAPTMGTRVLHHFIERGLGRGLAERMKAEGRPLLTTFFAPAIAAEHHGAEQISCVVTDADINRAWAPLLSRTTRIRYFVPSIRAQRRLVSYGVPQDRITYTGFPLPHGLLGGPDLETLKGNLARRLARLDPAHVFRSQLRDELAHVLGPLQAAPDGPPRLCFAVGGAGAQVEVVRRFLPGMASSIRRGRLALTLVAGVRPEVSAKFKDAITASGLDDDLEAGRIEILEAPTMAEYLARFHARLADVDVLWSKPSELTFFAALGLPLVFCPPIGVHEDYNRRWAIEAGGGLRQRDPAFAAEWLDDWLADGTLAGAAWGGFMRLPKCGLYRILSELR
ncbi:MAG: hypothetical protein ABI321_02985 [Polyangia bacterium]